MINYDVTNPFNVTQIRHYNNTPLNCHAPWHECWHFKTVKREKKGGSVDCEAVRSVAGACRSGRPLYCTADTLHSASGSCNATTMHHSHLLPPNCAHTHKHTAHISLPLPQMSMQCMWVCVCKMNLRTHQSIERWACSSSGYVCETPEEKQTQSRSSETIMLLVVWNVVRYLLFTTLSSQFPDWARGTEMLERRWLLALLQWDRQATAPSPFRAETLKLTALQRSSTALGRGWLE